MSRKLITTKQYITRATIVHKGKFKYDRLEYINMRTKVTITCTSHGDFQQCPKAHLTGQGCRSCSQVTTLKFIAKAQKVHGGLYDYSLVRYAKASKKVDIICRQHGTFMQTGNKHLSGAGCPSCKGGTQLSTEVFVAKALGLHSGLRYDYSKVQYRSSHVEVIIICQQHGPFQIKPNYHLCGGKCPSCSKCVRYNTETWICKAREVHGDLYDYSKTVYKSTQTKVVITCKKHGDFEQTPANHVSNRHGCPSCSHGWSKEAVAWLDTVAALDNVNVRHVRNGGEVTIPATMYKADGFVADSKKVLEYHGSYWHGNPRMYDQGFVHPITKKTMGEMHDKTMKREQELRDLGYEVETIWDDEWNIVKFMARLAHERHN